MLNKTSGKFIIGFVVVILAIIAVAAWNVIETEKNGGEVGACTMEAFVCPDGTGVGRTGQACKFTACPNAESFTGELLRDGDGFKLVIAAPESLPGAAYSMSLVVADKAAAEKLVGEVVTVRGEFTEGATLAVREVARAPAETVGIDGREATAKIGATVFIRGLKIKLLEVTQDSRCPVGVQCVLAGAVTARVELLSDTDRETVLIASDKAPHAFDIYNISIVRAEPLAKAGATILPADYKITFRADPLAAAVKQTQSAVREFVVVAKNFSFSVPEIVVNKGERVRITFKNVEGFHDFKIDEFNVASKQIGAGAADTIEFTADKDGAFEYYCSIGKHRAMGMKGILRVR